MENRTENAIEDVLIGTFLAEGDLSAHGKAAKFISSLSPTNHYLGWDGEVYPKIWIKKIEVQ